MAIEKYKSVFCIAFASIHDFKFAHHW